MVIIKTKMNKSLNFMKIFFFKKLEIALCILIPAAEAPFQSKLFQVLVLQLRTS